jgi:hypothetical protein
MEYKSQNVICQNCKNDFTIESDDFSFYEKIKVPPPTFCPECRFIRKYLWRNERFLHKRECDLCKKSVISMYHQSENYTVYCPDCYRSDNWDPMIYALDYDFSKSFFEQYKKLLQIVPRPSLIQSNSINSSFGNYIESVSNVYLSYSVKGEHLYYCRNITDAKQLYDCYDVFNSEKCYENVGCDRNYNSAFIYNSKGIIDSYFVFGSSNLSNCFMCTNLKGGQFFIKNIKYSKEDYFQILKSYKLNTKEGLEKAKNDFQDFYLKALRRYMNSINVLDCTGDDLYNCRKVLYSFGLNNCENSKYLNRCLDVKDSMDCSSFAQSELGYEFIGGGAFGSQNVKFSLNLFPSNIEVEYSDLCGNVSNVFGSISLKNKQYCILNKQYSKEEYFETIEKIKFHMNEMPYIDKKGIAYKYGEFFPFEFSPFAYNESTAQEYYPLKKNEIRDKGYRFREKENKEYKIEDNIYSCDNLGDEDTLCTKAFRVLPEEFDFYKSLEIALPSKCPNCRYFDRTKYKNPLKLWHRKCMKEGCNNEFETSYAPDRPEIVYCEKCYQGEVY